MNPSPSRRRPLLPWIAAALACVLAIVARQFLIQPPEIGQRCESATLTLATPGPWWCSVRAAIVMTYAWGGLNTAAVGLSIASLALRRVPVVAATLAAATLTVGLVAIVWYSYEAGALAITIGTIALARAQADLRSWPVGASR